jgi:DNA repair protein RadC
MRRIEHNISRFAEQVLDKRDGDGYVYDPKHELRKTDLPDGQDWHETDRGWSSVKGEVRQEDVSSSPMKLYHNEISQSLGNTDYVRENVEESMRQMEMAFSVAETPYDDYKVKIPIPKSDKLRKRRENIERLVNMWSEQNVEKILPAGQEGKVDLLLFDQIKKNPTVGLELSVDKGIKIKNAKDVATLMWKFRDPLQEKLTVISVGAGDKLLSARVATVGLLDSASASPSVILSNLPKGTKRIVISHNHPSGDSSPSKEDLEATRRIKSACDQFGIQLADHVVTNGNYVSFRERNLVNFTPSKYSGGGSPNGMSESPSEQRYNPKDPDYHLAEWEAVPYHMRPKASNPQESRDILEPFDYSARGGKFIHVGKVDTKSRVVGVERISADANGGDDRLHNLTTRIHKSVLANGGCAAYIVGYNYNDPDAHVINDRLSASSKVMGIYPSDFIDKDYRSARTLGIYHPAMPHQALGPEGMFKKPNQGVWGN